MSRVYEKNQDELIKDAVNKKVVKFEKPQQVKTNQPEHPVTSNHGDAVMISKDMYIATLEHMVDRLTSICDAQKQIIDTYEAMLMADDED